MTGLPGGAPRRGRVVTPEEARFVDLGSVGVRFLARAVDTGGALSIVEHPIPPRGLAAPLHRHAREDEYSYVLEGTMGAQLGDQVMEATAGSLVFKPRGEWHTFWNAGTGPAVCWRSSRRAASRGCSPRSGTTRSCSRVPTRGRWTRATRCKWTTTASPCCASGTG